MQYYISGSKMEVAMQCNTILVVQRWRSPCNAILSRANLIPKSLQLVCNACHITRHALARNFRVRQINLDVHGQAAGEKR